MLKGDVTWALGKRCHGKQQCRCRRWHVRSCGMCTSLLLPISTRAAASWPTAAEFKVLRPALHCVSPWFCMCLIAPRVWRHVAAFVARHGRPTGKCSSTTCRTVGRCLLHWSHSPPAADTPTAAVATCVLLALCVLVTLPYVHACHLQPWFVWMLWCFNVAYVILVALASKVLPALKRARTRDDSAASLTQLPTTTSSRSRSSSTKVAQDGTFTTAELLRHSAWLTAILCTTCFAVRMINVFQYNIKPAQFVQRGPFVQFMPDFLPVYAAAFALGIFSGPSAWNVLARLPDQWGSWCLWVAGVWWVLAGWLLNVTLHPWMSMQYGKAAYVLTWLLRTFVEQSFCVYWSIGLLVVFRLAYNTKPGWVGRQYINGAYGAYLVHLPLVFLLARAFMSFSFQSAVVNAVIIAPFAVAGSWLIACALRAIPGADRVL